MITTILVLLVVAVLLCGASISFLPTFYVWVYRRTLKELEKNRR